MFVSTVAIRPHQLVLKPYQKVMSITFYVLGALITLVGIFCFLVGDMQVPAFAELNEHVKTVYENQLYSGIKMGLFDTISYYTIKFAMLVIIGGILLILNAWMLVGQKFERYRDFLCVLPAIVALAIFTYYPLLDLFRISFTNWNLMKEEYKFVGWKNYKWLFDGSG